MNTKTVNRAFTVLLCLITCFVMIMAVTPLSFASSLSGQSSRTQLKTDGRRPYLTTYFYGLNSGMIDCKVGSTWRRFIFDNTKLTVNCLASGGINYLWFSPISDYSTLYYFNIGSSYGSFSSTSWTTVLVDETKEFSLGSGTIEIRFANCGIENGFNGSQTISNTSNVYANAYYPIMESSTVNLNTVYNNQSSIIDKVNENESKNQSRFNAEQSAQSSRQAEIMNEGSDLTVSTIDNWIGGSDGLAEKMTRLAETLSENAYRFSQNQVQVSSKLAQAGDLINGALSKFPAPLIACMFCFLVILIAVKVIGR